jgi:hypothetical protein
LVDVLSRGPGLTEVRQREYYETTSNFFIIQIWALFESYLKDLISLIQEVSPAETESAIRIAFQARPKNLRIRMLQNPPYHFRRWYNMKILFEEAWGLEFFPNNPPSGKYGIESSIDGDLSYENRLKILQVCRNAVVHSKGEITQEDVKQTKLDRTLPDHVQLDEPYVKYSFSLIQKLVERVDDCANGKFNLLQNEETDAG